VMLIPPSAGSSTNRDTRGGAAADWRVGHRGPHWTRGPASHWPCSKSLSARVTPGPRLR
jgi:hypothetical protein